MTSRSLVWLLASTALLLAGCADERDDIADLGGRADPDARVRPDAGSTMDMAVEAAAPPLDTGVTVDASRPTDAGTAPDLMSDAGSLDAASPDTGPAMDDAGPTMDDAAPVDAAPADAAPMDGGPLDLGPPDLGAPDTGPPDAGMASAYRGAVLASGPIAYWPFDETTGTLSTDIVGGRVLTSSGGVTMATPSLVAGDGDAIRFEGTGWAAMAADDPSLQHNPYSVELWLRHDAVAGNNLIAEVRGPDARGWTLGSQLFGWTVDQGTSAGGAWLEGPRPAYAAARIYHVVFTYDGSTLRFYVDGELLGSVAGGFSPSDNPLVVGAGLCARCATGGFCSGCETGAVARAFWEGAMDELAYYDRALPQSEIRAHDSAGRDGTYRDLVLAAGPIAYWPFDETTGTVSTDIVGGRVLTSSGVLTMATPSLVAGGGDAIRFDGTGWTSMAASDPSLQHNPYSIEVWVRARTGAPHDVPFFIGGRDSDATSTRGYQLAHHQPLGQLVADQGTGGEWLAMRSPFALDHTYHLVMTYDGAQARLYIDGALADSETGGFSPSVLPLVVGADSTVPGRYPLHGVMDEFAYYDRALTLPEIEAHHERGLAP